VRRFTKLKAGIGCYAEVGGWRGADIFVGFKFVVQLFSLIGYMQKKF
jgi:hypothetical protein